VYAHQVIGQYIDFINNWDFSPAVKYMVKDLSSRIYKCHKFHIGDIEWLSQTVNKENLETTIFFKKFKNYIKLPYNSCWFDYNLKIYDDFNINDLPKNVYPSKKLGIFAINVKKRKEIHLAPIFYSKVWQVPVGAGIINFKKNICQYSSMGIDEIREMFKDEYNLEFLKEGINKALFALMETLVLMNCKNIITEEINKPEKLNKKRRKTGKVELFKYYVLKIKPTKTNQSEPGGRREKGMKRIHFCRGHFKEYTKTNPLDDVDCVQ